MKNIIQFIPEINSFDKIKKNFESVEKHFKFLRFKSQIFPQGHPPHFNEASRNREQYFNMSKPLSHLNKKKLFKENERGASRAKVNVQQQKRVCK